MPHVAPRFTSRRLTEPPGTAARPSFTLAAVAVKAAVKAAVTLAAVVLVCAPWARAQEQTRGLRVQRAEAQSVESMIEAGDRLADAGRWEEAVKVYRLATELDAKSGEARLRLAEALMSAGRWEEALDSYRRAVSADGRNAEAHYALGRAFNDMGQHGDAFKPLVRAIQLDPGFAEAHHGIGWAYLRTDQFDKALPFLRGALRLKPDYDEAVYALALAYYRLGQRAAADEQRRHLAALSPPLLRELDTEVARLNREAPPAASQAQRDPQATAARDERAAPARNAPAATAKGRRAAARNRAADAGARAAAADTAAQPARAAAAQAPRTPDSAAFELTFWETIKDSTDPEDFRDYLRRYPDGVFANLARRRAAPRTAEAPTQTADPATTNTTSTTNTTNTTPPAPPRNTPSQSALSTTAATTPTPASTDDAAGAAGTATGNAAGTTTGSAPVIAVPPSEAPRPPAAPRPGTNQTRADAPAPTAGRADVAAAPPARADAADAHAGTNKTPTPEPNRATAPELKEAAAPVASSAAGKPAAPEANNAAAPERNTAAAPERNTAAARDADDSVRPPAARAELPTTPAPAPEAEAAEPTAAPPAPASKPSYEDTLAQAEAAWAARDAEEAARLLAAAVALAPSRAEAYQTLGVVELYGRQDLSAAARAMRAALERGGTAAFAVTHDHDGSFGSYCQGSLYVTRAGVSYQAGDGTHAFHAAAADIREAKPHGARADNPAFFHIRLKGSGGAADNHYFAPGTSKAEETALILSLIPKP